MFWVASQFPSLSPARGWGWPKQFGLPLENMSHYYLFKFRFQAALPSGSGLRGVYSKEIYIVIKTLKCKNIQGSYNIQQ